MSELDKLNLEQSTAEDRADMLDVTEWSHDFNLEQLEVVANYLTHYSIPKGHYVFKEGSRERYLGLVVEGTLDVVKRNDKQEEQTLAQFRKGKVFGEMALVDESPRSASIKAGPGCEVLIMSYEQFHQLIEDKPAFAIKILLKIAQMLSMRLRKTSGDLVDHLGK